MRIFTLLNIPLITNSLFVAVFILTCLFGGAFVLKYLCRDISLYSPLERLLLRFGLGSGLISLLTFLLGSCGQFNTTAFALEFGVVIALGDFSWRENLTDIRSVFTTIRCNVPKSLAGRMIIAIFSICLVALLFQALSPTLDPDGLGYHLQAPKRWLQFGDLRYLPTLVQTQSPMALEMLYSIALSVMDDTSAKLIHFCFGCAAALAVYCLGRRVHGRRVGLAAAALFCLGIPKNYGFGEFGIAYVDLGAVFALTLALNYWVVSVRNESQSALFLSGLLLGIGGSIKIMLLPAGLLLMCISLLFIKNPGFKRVDWVKFNLFALFPIAPWLIRSWFLTGNPIWPMFSSIFRTRDWTPELARDYPIYMRYTIWAENSTRLSLLVREVMVLGSMAIVLLLTLWMIRRQSDLLHKSLWAFGSGILLITMFGGGLYLRYFLPVFPLYFVLMATKFAPRIPWKSAAWPLAFWLGINGVLLLKGMNPGFAENVRAALGVMSRDEYLNRNYGDYAVLSKLGKSGGQEGSILVSGTGATYYCDAYCFLADGIRQGVIDFSSIDHLDSTIKKSNIIWILIADGAEKMHGGILFPEVKAEYRVLFEYARDRCTFIMKQGRLSAYRVRL